MPSDGLIYRTFYCFFPCQPSFFYRPGIHVRVRIHFMINCCSRLCRYPRREEYAMITISFPFPFHACSDRPLWSPTLIAHSRRPPFISYYIAFLLEPRWLLSYVPSQLYMCPAHPLHLCPFLHLRPTSSRIQFTPSGSFMRNSSRHRGPKTQNQCGLTLM